MDIGGSKDWPASSGPAEADRIDWALHQMHFEGAVALHDEEDAQGWAFLAEVSRVLAAADVDTLETLGLLAVPVLADYCVLDVVDEGCPCVHRIVRGGGDAAAQALLGELQAQPPTATLPRAVARGRPVVLTRPSDSELADLVGPHDAAVHRRLGLQSGVALPLRGPARLLGALLLVSTRPGLSYGDTSLALADDFAARAALAVAHAQSYRQAREAERRKDELLAMVAHELRTPLGCVVTALEALARLGSSARAPVELHRTVLRQARRIARLVDDLLDVAWVRTGALALRLERLDLREIVRECRDGLQSGERLAGRTVSLTCAPDPVTVEGDRLRLEQVVVNLLDNAVKYTPPGGAISLTVEPEAGHAVIRVQDSGIGIAGDVLPHIFEPFVRADTAAATAGVGLGLAVVRRIVEQHRGTVSAHSPGPGRGTLVVVRLPRARAAGA